MYGWRSATWAKCPESSREKLDGGSLVNDYGTAGSDERSPVCSSVAMGLGFLWILVIRKRQKVERQDQRIDSWCRVLSKANRGNLSAPPINRRRTLYALGQPPTRNRQAGIGESSLTCQHHFLPRMDTDFSTEMMNTNERPLVSIIARFGSGSQNKFYRSGFSGNV